jgi:tRNA A22 N-methylase
MQFIEMTIGRMANKRLTYKGLIDGTRQYQLNTLSQIHLRNISNCVLAGMGLPPLT